MKSSRSSRSASTSTSRRALFRPNSSRSSVFGTVDKNVSRTFSLSSSDNDDDTIRPTESFDDEQVEEEGAALIQHRFIPDLRVPLEKVHVPRKSSNFCMETMVRRDETKTRYIMYLQSTEGAYPIFCAQKYPPLDGGGQIVIKSIDGNSRAEMEAPRSKYHPVAPATILGSLVKKKKRHLVSYELLLDRQATKDALPSVDPNDPAPPPPRKSGPLVVATMAYDQISKARYLLEGSKPRRAKVTILGRESMHVETKRANQEANGQKVMDFGGRGLETSNKNTQLAIYASGEGGSTRLSDFHGGDDGCCLQMVKWKENEFNVDFGSPFDAFHAFAFALAQFDY